MNTQRQRLSDGSSGGQWWRTIADSNRIECDLCPRQCNLKPGDKGFCFVRENRDGQMVLSTYGRSTGFCIDPIEKKPLNHFYPGTAVLSFGTAGCNLGCQFCQNWDISKSREVERLSQRAEPEQIAAAATSHGCHSVAFTYNDPVIWAEYAIDTAQACRQAGVQSVAVTAGYICDAPRREFFAEMDAANVDLKAFSEEFYHKITYSHLQPVLETISYLKRETDVWFELTNLIIPNANDGPDELRKMCDWILHAVGDEVPIHFSAFHPDFRMLDRERTDPDTLQTAYEIAQSCGLKFPYVGNTHDVVRQSTYCPNCKHLLIERDWYQLGAYNMDAGGNCGSCGQRVAGKFDATCGSWGNKRQPVRIDDFDSGAHKQVVQISGIASTSQVESQSAAEANNSTKPAGGPIPTQLFSEDLAVPETQTNSTSAATGAAAPAATLLPLDRLTSPQRRTIVQSAASWLAQSVLQQPVKNSPDALGEITQQIVMGVFVTLKRGDVLRGCCGVLGKPMHLGAAIAAAATKTAKEDKRFAPISPVELPFLSIDVTLLGPFRQVKEIGAERESAVQIGKHGVTIQRGNKSGLLLPSVATERDWDARRFLQAVCTKAGLPIGAWESEDATLTTFSGESMGGALSEYLPINLDSEIQPPLSSEQLTSYAQLAGQNIVACATGGTPSYVVPHLPDTNVNAIVLSMQWGVEGAEEKQQGNALQVSLRPGIPLQSTLFQMCQRAASMFQQNRFAGQLQIGLSIGYDPALHGWGLTADIEGVDSQRRALVISDSQHCGFAFDPGRSTEDLRQVLHQSLPIGSRDATLHSMAVMSTMPHVISVSGPTPVAASGVRPPAVAGKFYPAEDAARRAAVEALCKDKPSQTQQPLAIMVPHAGLKYSGRVAAKTWASVADLNSRTIIVISPKHTRSGVNWSACPFTSWRLSNTTSFVGASELAQKLVEAVTPLKMDAAAHQNEHGIEVQLPILERLAPQTKVVGLALHSGSWPDIQAAAIEMAGVLRELDDMPLLVISSDMNHYASDEENRRRDRLALDALASGDPEQLIETCAANEITMCGLIPAAFVMETLRQLGKSFRVEEVGYATSGDVTGDRSQVVGYAGALFVE